METPRVSVVIPTYNRRESVGRALDSVLAQQPAPFEVLVVDDGSSDGTEALFAAPPPGVRYLRQPNRGASSARNHGIREARGEWIAFLDSDDVWLPGKLAAQLAHLEGAKVCFSAAVDERGERLDDLPQMTGADRGEARIGADDPAFFLHARHPFIQSALIERAALLDAGGFDEGLRVAEDTKLLYELVSSLGFVAVLEPGVRVTREREVAGLSDDLDPETARVRYRCYARVQSEFADKLAGRLPQAAATLRRNRAFFASRWAELAARGGHRAEAREAGRLGLRQHRDWRSTLRSLAACVAPGAFGALLRRRGSRPARQLSPPPSEPIEGRPAAAPPES